MAHSDSKPNRTAAKSGSSGITEISPQHYLRVILHRKWLVLGAFFVVSVATFLIASRLPNVYSSETLILVDPQKVPDAYVKSTVTGDVRNRLGTLSQQILSATRLQRIIETLNLYPEDRKKMAREDVITRMRADINVSVVSDFSANQDLQAFRIRYSGADPRLVARVTNELASLFIEENLKAREQQATGTTEFLDNQLEETRKALETQEARLKDYKLRHVGEMPEQQTANLQIMGQMQSQLQLEAEALNRAEQQKGYIQSLMVQAAPVVDLDDGKQAGPTPNKENISAGPVKTPLMALKARLADLRAKYTEDHPDVRRLKKQIAEEEAKAATALAEAKSEPVAETPAPTIQPDRPATAQASHYNPVLQSQLNTVEAEIAKHKEEVARLSKSVAGYRSKLEAIPVREQEMTQLVRDYETAKAHYTQLLDKQMSAQTATQLEIRQKGEKFEVLDPAQPAEKPSRPNRYLINVAGSLSGLLLGVLLAIGTEFLGMSITAPEDVTAATGLPVLEVIPVIVTPLDRRIRRKRLFIAGATAAVGCLAIATVVFLRTQA
jgi:polysaccharide biosynthesis transport protein